MHRGRSRVSAAVAAACAVAGSFAAGAAPGVAEPATGSMVRFEKPSVLVSEGERRVVLRVERTHTIALEAAEADFHSEDIDALAPGDYDESSGHVEISVGHVFTTITVPIRDDLQFESHERFRVLLTDAQDRYRVLDRVTVEIVDDDDQLSDEPIDHPDGAPGAVVTAPPPAARGTVSVTRRSSAAAVADSTPRPSGTRRSEQASPRKRASTGKPGRVAPFQLQAPAEQAGGDGATRPGEVLAVVAAAAFAVVLARLWFWRRTAVAAAAMRR